MSVSRWTARTAALAVVPPVTVSLHERAALFQMLTAWARKALTDAELDPAGDGFDLMQMAGVPAMLSVTVVEKDDAASTTASRRSRFPQRPSRTEAGERNPRI